ncbi:hypothetical protein ACFR9U_02420 [Halorientalis brevis]|uniref:Uncharacterized protein n=1 Tax=Halorientalis brevis TaxID=1126241 RepID=A0ABD6C6D0_9EURY|nr:hypothetical protein [Halorientalis brevis]
MVDGPTRRDFLSTLTKVGVVTGTTGAATAGYRLSTLPMDLRNLDLPPAAIARLARSSPVDWQYCWDAAISTVPQLTMLFGNKLGGMQELSAEAGFVSTPDDGIAAGVTETGRMSTLLFPATGFTHHLPYYSHDAAAPHLGAKPHAGGFGGLRLDGTTTWLWDDAADHGIDYEPDTGLLELQYDFPRAALTGAADDATVRSRDDAAGRVLVDETFGVVPGTETIAREFRVHNESSARLDGEFYYHTQANVTANQQNFVVWQSDENRLVADDGLRWTDLDGPYELSIYGDSPVTHSSVARTGPGDSDEATANAPAGLLPSVVESDRASVEGRYLSGVLGFDLSVPPGEYQDLTIFVTGGPDVARLPEQLAASRDRRLARARRYWADRVGNLQVDALPARYREAAVRAAITVSKLADPSSGSISASGNLQPSYYPTWPRDGSFAAVALARAGLPEPGKRYLARYLPHVQEDDGSFRQCYDSRGVDAGVLTVENDQQPIYAWAVRELYDETGDESFRRAAWPAVRDALDYTVDAVASNGLLVATPDIQEGPTSSHQSLWTNAMAYEGLLSGATLARVADEDPAPYSEAAETIGQSLRDRFFDRDQFVTDVGFWGTQRDLKGFNGAAVWPSRWAAAFGEVGTITSALRENYKEQGIAWIPGELLAAGALARAGDTHTADAILDDVLAQTAPSGYLAEETTDSGEHILGSPLGWSSSMLLLVLAERFQ